MAGYIGSKAVTLSTTAADVAGNAVIDGDLTVKGTTVTIDSAAAQEIRLGDNDKMTFGDATGGDLQIYHDGSHSYVDENGTGQLKIRSNGTGVLLQTVSGENLATFANNAAVSLYYDNAAKLATTSTGVDITGTLTSNDANGVSQDGQLNVGGNSNARGEFFYDYSLGDLTIENTWNSDAGEIFIRAGGALRQQISGNGDISFYEDTGTTTKFFWDASTERLGIGTTSPNVQLKLEHATRSSLALKDLSTNNELYAEVENGVATFNAYTAGTGAKVPIVFKQYTTERMRIDSSGNVGIGTSSPFSSARLQVNTGTDLNLAVQTGTTLTNGMKINAFNNAGTLNIPLELNGSVVALKTGETERMRLDASGRVGLGNTNPQRELHIGAADNTNHEGIIVLNNGGATGYRAGIEWRYESNTTPRARISINASSQSLEFDTAGTLRMRLGSNGRLGIGTTAPDAKLMVETAANVEQPFAINDSSNTAGQTHRIAFRTGGTEVGTIKSTNSGTSFNTTSDYRLKENVTDVTDGITRVKQLAPKRFNFIVNPDVTVDGFIAHEAQSVVPEAVTGTQDAMRDEEYEVTPAVLDDDGNEVTPAVMGTRSVPDYQGIDQSKLVPLLTAALQEAIAKIETLETEMTSVKARLDALEAE
jgi:hypothetical protein